MSACSLHRITFDDVVILPGKTKPIPFAFVPRSNHSSEHSLNGLDWKRRTSSRWNSEPLLNQDDSESNSCSLQDKSGAVSGSLDNVINSNAALAYGIDPSLYSNSQPESTTFDEQELSFDEENIGRVWLSLEYNPESERLTVLLMWVKNLPSRTRASNNACDPVVRICLLPDERRWLQSKIKSRSCNPRYEESFAFYVPQKEFERRTLKVVAYDVDRHRMFNKIGQFTYSLQEHKFEPGEKVIIWRDLENVKTTTPLKKNSIYFSLSYNGFDRLNVGVYSGKNLSLTSATENKDTHHTDFIVKVTLYKDNKKMKSKRTSVAKETGDMTMFNEMFQFQLLATETDISNVELAVVQSHRIQKDQQVGRVVLGSFMFARGPQLEHWNEVMMNPKKQISRWHDLVS